MNLNLLQFRTVSEVMNEQVICATAQTSLFEIAQLMATHHVSCVVIVEENCLTYPVGIITERDLVQVQMLGLDLENTLAAIVMSSPVWKVQREDSLAIANQTMESHHISHLIVIGNQGELQGLVTETNILQLLKILEVYNIIDSLQEQIKQLQLEKIELLENRNLDLEKKDENGQLIQIAGSESDISDRKLAEAKLLELNQIKQAILDGTNYAIICTDMNGIIQVWNQGSENLLGYQAQEMIGKKTPAIIHDPQEVLERSYSLSLELGTKIEPGFEVFVAKARLGQIEEREWSYIHKNGTKFPVLLSVCALRDQTGNITGFLGIAQDLTERKRTATEIRVAEERFQLAIQAAQDGFWDWDFIAGTIYYSPRWKEMIGYNNDELPNKLSSWEKVIFEEDRIAAIKLIEDYNQGRIDRFQAIQRFHHKNGSTVYILSRAIHLKDEQGKVIRMVGAHTDITELQKAQEVLKQQLAAIEAAIDGIAILKDRHYIYLNQAHLELFGYTHAEELLGKTWTVLYKPEQLKYFEQHTFPILSQQRHWQGEATAQRKDGSTFAEEISLTLTDDDLLICVCRDVTERLKAEEKIKASLLEKEVLLREIHHRVKNNLYVISNLLDLQADTFEQEEQRKLFAESQNRIQTMALIHEQLYQSDDLSQVNFANYIQNLVEKLSLSYRTKHCEVKIILDVEPITLNLETAIPCGLLINELVTNSFKYAFPNSQYGEIKIELKLREEQQIYLKISDNGIGIPENVDWQDSPSLGLRLVNILADQLEASVEVNCSQGTSFSLLFKEQSYN